MRAAAITLFEVFMHLLEQQGDLDHAFPPSVWPSIPVIIEETLKCVRRTTCVLRLMPL